MNFQWINYSQQGIKKIIKKVIDYKRIKHYKKMNKTKITKDFTFSKCILRIL